MRTLLSVVIATGVVLASCGSDDDSLSKDEYIEAGDRICRQFLEDTESVEIPTAEDEIVEFLDRILALAEETSDDFADLDPPSDAEDVHDALVTSLSDSIDLAREARDAAASGDLDEAERRLDEASEAGSRADAQAKDYGFEVCGSEDEIVSG